MQNGVFYASKVAAARTRKRKKLCSIFLTGHLTVLDTYEVDTLGYSLLYWLGSCVKMLPQFSLETLHRFLGDGPPKRLKICMQGSTPPKIRPSKNPERKVLIENWGTVAAVGCLLFGQHGACLGFFSLSIPGPFCFIASRGIPGTISVRRCGTAELKTRRNNA